MGERRRVRLRWIGGVQVVRILAGFDLPGDAAVLRREGERLVIEPVCGRGLRMENCLA